jgi:hypothetical protein
MAATSICATGPAEDSCRPRRGPQRWALRRAPGCSDREPLKRGMCEQRNRTTGETRSLPFIMNDMRFMKGMFRGHDGHVRGATFALV